MAEAFVLPLPGRSIGVVFWERARRGEPSTKGAASQAFAVYAPAALSPGEAAELSAALYTALGEASGGEPSRLSAWPRLLWLAMGGASAVMLALRALELGPAYSFLCLLVVGATLPWGSALRGGRARRARALHAARRIADISPEAGTDARSIERLASLWQHARRQSGAELTQVNNLEQFCREQSWLAAARVYSDLAGTGSAPATSSWRRGLRWKSRATGARPYASLEMRAWP